LSQTGVHREKNPAAVKEAIISEACRFISEYGMPALTLQAVADRAGVTKSGLLHHFKSKDALLTELRTHAFGKFSETLESHMQHDTGGEGIFTRAYIRTCLESVRQHSDLLFITALWSDPEMKSLWYAWLAEREARYIDSDGGSTYKILRLATDGAWLAALDGRETREVEKELLAMAGDNV